jgi:hypothetical protein
MRLCSQPSKVPMLTFGPAASTSGSRFSVVGIAPF